MWPLLSHWCPCSRICQYLHRSLDWAQIRPFLGYHVSWIVHLNLFIISRIESCVWPSEVMRSHPCDYDKTWQHISNRLTLYVPQKGQILKFTEMYQLLLVIMHKEILWTSLSDTMNSFFWLLYFPTVMVWNGEVWHRQVIQQQMISWLITERMYKKAVMTYFKVLSKNIQRLWKATNTSQATLFLSHDLNVLLIEYKEALLTTKTACVKRFIGRKDLPSNSNTWNIPRQYSVVKVYWILHCICCFAEKTLKKFYKRSWMNSGLKIPSKRWLKYYSWRHRKKMKRQSS